MTSHKHHVKPRHKGGTDGPTVSMNPWDHAELHAHRFINDEDTWFHGGLLEYLEPQLKQLVLKKFSEVRQEDNWWNDGTNEKRSSKQPGPNFVQGRLPYSEESYQKISEAHTGKRWWTNGEKLVFDFVCPEGFYAGKAPHSEKTKQLMSQTHKGKKWWTDGQSETFRFDCPEGFRPGRKPGRKCPRG